jgi:hypothetical protein
LFANSLKRSEPSKSKAIFGEFAKEVSNEGVNNRNSSGGIQDGGENVKRVKRQSF